MNNKITHEGELELLGLKLPCYVLEDGTRVISGRGMQNALKIGYPSENYTNEEQKSGVELSRFLGSKWFKDLITNKYELEHFKPIYCFKGNQKINGFEASTLVDFCNVMLEARSTGELKTDRQLAVASQSEIIIRTFAKIGIIALVDEATGYQYEREKNELQVILKAYIAKELIAWQKRFPDSFYQEIFRLNNWDFTVSNIKKRPGVVGTWTNKLIYEQLPKGILDELKRVTPKTSTGSYKARFHQSLTEDIGNPDLQSQIYKVIGIMNISDNWKDFIRNFNKMIARKSGQLELKFKDFEPPKEIVEENKTKGFDLLLHALLNVPSPQKDK